MSRPILYLLLAFTGVSVPAMAADLAIGSSLPEFVAEDQHGEAFVMGVDTHQVLVSFDMNGGRRANKYFSEQAADYLADRKAVYLANVDGMPKVARFFAFRKMRKYPHRIILIESAETIADIPSRPDHVTLLTLDAASRILSVQFWDPESVSLDTLLNQNLEN